MSLIIQTFWILFFYLLGLGVSFLIGGVIPGAVLGMIFLFLALSLGYVKEKSVSSVAQALLSNMVLFFLPATVGLITTFALVARNLIPISVAVIVSTVLIIVSVAVVAQKMERNPKVRQFQKRLTSVVRKSSHTSSLKKLK